MLIIQLWRPVRPAQVLHRNLLGEPAGRLAHVHIVKTAREGVPQNQERKSSIFVTSQAVVKFMGRPLICGLTYAGTQESDHLHAPGCSVANVLLGVMNCRDTGAPILVKRNLCVQSVQSDL